MKNQRMRTLQKKIYKYKIFINARYTPGSEILPGVFFVGGLFYSAVSFN